MMPAVCCRASFFTAATSKGGSKPGQQLILHGKAEIDKLRPARLEMINPQIEVLGSEEMDSTEVGRIVPIYEAIGTFGSRQIRRAMYAAGCSFIRSEDAGRIAGGLALAPPAILRAAKR